MNWRTWCTALLGYWIMLILAYALDLFTFKWEVTLGDIALGIIAGIATILVAIFKFWLPRHPFTVGFYEKPWDTEDEENPSTDWLIIHGERGRPQTFFIGVRLRTERTFKTVDIRLNRFDLGWYRKSGFLWREPPKNIAIITKIKDQQFPWNGEDKDNKKGGREADYGEPIHSPRHAIMWYEVTATAWQDWNGTLAFQLRRGSSHKGHARARLCFKVTPRAFDGYQIISQ